jgi:branched-chain amino acid transport system ATP-binding protein
MGSICFGWTASPKASRGLTALSDVSFGIERGQIKALIGPNGAGKTTTLKAISGVLYTELGDVTDGDIEFNEMRIDGKAPEEIVQMGIFNLQNIQDFVTRLT